MPSFPNLSSGKAVKYPLTRSHRRRTRVLTSVDQSEQRFSMGTPLDDFSLTFSDVKTADKELIRDFFNARNGAFDTSWDLTLIDGYTRSEDVTAATGEVQTWNHLQFAPGQPLETTEIKPGRWQVSMKIRETRRNDA